MNDSEKYIKIQFGLIKDLRPIVPDDVEVIIYEDGLIMDPEGMIYGWIRDFFDAPKLCPDKLRALAEKHGKSIMVDDKEVGVLGDDEEDEEFDDGDEPGEEPDWMQEEEDEE